MSAEEVVGHAGRVAGREVAMRFGRYTSRFTSPDPRVRFFVHESHYPFIVQPIEAADCEVEWRIGDVILSPTPMLRRAGERWELRRTVDGLEEFAFRSTAANVPTLCMHLTRDFRRVCVVQAPREGLDHIVFASEYPWAEFLVCRLLGRDGGLLVHASCAVIDDGAVLFVGHSGAGKSTVAEIAERCGASILSDDRTILTVEDDVTRAWGTPWHGSLARTSPASAPLRGMFLLVQDTETWSARIPTNRALKEIFVRLIQPRITPREVENTIDALMAVLGRCPLHLLHFRPTADAFDLACRVAATRG